MAALEAVGNGGVPLDAARLGHYSMWTVAFITRRRKWTWKQNIISLLGCPPPPDDKGYVSREESNPIRPSGLAHGRGLRCVSTNAPRQKRPFVGRDASRVGNPDAQLRNVAEP